MTAITCKCKSTVLVIFSKSNGAYLIHIKMSCEIRHTKVPETVGAHLNAVKHKGDSERRERCSSHTHESKGIRTTLLKVNFTRENALSYAGSKRV